MRSSKSRKTLQQQHFIKQQLTHLKTKSWWIANTQTPYWIKFTTYENAILIKCTNMTNLYVKRFSESEIKEDQEVYAKGLTVKDFKDLLIFFEGILGDRDEKAKYGFRENLEEGSVDFRFEKMIEFFPFSWKFKLYKVDCDIKEIICNEIINPMAFALQRQSRRQEILRRRAEQLEKQLIKKMTDTQKKMYKSSVTQTQEQWKILCKKQHNMYVGASQVTKQLLFPYVFDNFVSFAIRDYLKPFTQQKPKVPIQALLQARSNTQLSKPSSNSKQVPHQQKPKMTIDQEEQLQFKFKYTKQDQLKLKKEKKKKDNLGGIDFL